MLVTTMPSPLNLRNCFPLLVVLVIFCAAASSSFAQSTAEPWWPYPGSFTSLRGCPIFVENSPTHYAQENGNCTVGTLLILTGVNFSDSVDATTVYLGGQSRYNLSVLFTNYTTIIAELPENPEPSMGWDYLNAFLVSVYNYGARLPAWPRRELVVWYNNDSVAATKSDKEHRVSSE